MGTHKATSPQSRVTGINCNGENLDLNFASSVRNRGDADVVMALRLQLERQKSGHLPSLREYARMYGISTQRMKLANSGALVMHPGPMNEGIEIDADVAHGAASVIEEQVTNGVAVRMALLYSLI